MKEKKEQRQKADSGEAVGGGVLPKVEMEEEYRGDKPVIQSLQI